MIRFLLFILLLMTSPVYAGLQVGLLLFEQNDYTSAFKELRSTAEQGDAQAQFLVGSMYFYGLGTEQDYVQAAHWFLNSAEQGFAQGQLGLATVYARGKGVKHNLVQTYAWLHLAAKHGLAEATYLQETLVDWQLLTAAQIQQAHHLSKHLVKCHQPEFKTDTKKTLNRYEQVFSKIASKQLKKLLNLAEATAKPVPKTTTVAIKKPLRQCIGKNNEINQKVLDCVLGK